MDKQEKFSIGKRLKSFKYAGAGLWWLLRYEHNARLHLLAAAAAVGMGLYLGISRTEWIAVVLCIGGVLALEGMNSALEALADYVAPEHQPLIGRAKDLAAGAVLVFAMGAAVVGALIFLDKLV